MVRHRPGIGRRSAALSGEAGRYYPLRWSTDRLNPGGAAYLDDAARGPERRIVQALCAGLRGVEAAEVRAEKGLVRISRQAACRAEQGQETLL